MADTEVALARPAASGAAGRPRHHLVVRITHWINVVAVTLMAGSGLRIFNAHPGFARIGEHFCCYPFEGKAIPAVLTFGGWLAGARNWHFAMMWLLVLNGLAYLGYTYLRGDWRELVPRRGDARDAWQMVRYYLSLRLEHPPQGKYNALQKLAYFSLPVVAALAVLTGLAIWKPVQLAPLTRALGGYVWARYFHFLAMLGLVALALGHVFMVLVTEPGALRWMVTGRPRAQKPVARVLDLRLRKEEPPHARAFTGTGEDAADAAEAEATTPPGVAGDAEAASSPPAIPPARHRGGAEEEG